MKTVDRDHAIVNTKAIPSSLRDHDRWVLWRNDDGTKVPITRKGRKTDPHKSRLSFDEVADALKDPDCQADGIGIVLYEGCGLVAVDLDKIDTWSDEAHDILDRLSPYGYSERSPSGNGYHIILAPKDVPEEHRVKHRDFFRGKVEVYTKARFLTVTGDDAEGDLGDMTAKGERVLHDFIAPLINAVEEEGEPDDSETDEEEDLTDEEVIMDALAQATKSNMPGFKAFKKIYREEDAFDDHDDPSDLMTAAVGAIVRIAGSQAQARRIMESCAAAPHYVDRKTGKSKLKRWLDSELPKIFKAESRSRKKKEKVRVQAQENDLFQRYVWLAPQNKYYDTHTGHVVITEAMDRVHFYELDGQKLSNLLKEEPDSLYADGRGWKPAPYRDGDQPFKPIRGAAAIYEEDGSLLVNTWKGYSVTPRPGNVDPWLDQIDSMFTEKEARHLIDRMAYDVQFPHLKCKWHPLIIGVQGSGKGSIFEPLRRIFSTSYGTMLEEAVKSGYDDELVRNKIVFLDEIKGLSGSTYEKLKAYSAADADAMFALNKKGEPKFMMPALWSFYAMSNHTDAMKLDAEERRWLVLKTERGAMSFEEATSYHTWLKNGGVSAVFDFLLNRDLSEFDDTMTPMKTRAMYDMAEAAVPRWKVVLDEYMTTEDWYVTEDLGLVNYASLSEKINREHRVSSTISGVKRYLEQTLGWGRIERIGTAVAKTDGKVRRQPVTLLAPLDSHLHDSMLRGTELYREIERLTNSAAKDFHGR